MIADLNGRGNRPLTLAIATCHLCYWRIYYRYCPKTAGAYCARRSIPIVDENHHWCGDWENSMEE